MTWFHQSDDRDEASKDRADSGQPPFELQPKVTKPLTVEFRRNLQINDDIVGTVHTWVERGVKPSRKELHSS